MYSGPHIKKDGLVFGYDTGQFSESNPNFDKFKPVKGRNRFYKGKSSVNYIAFQNPRIDSSYSSYTRGSGTWDSRHPNAITVYNQRGSNLSNYVNTGVGDWSNTDHAHWQFDKQLKKPVVVMHDRTGSWKAKSFGAAMGAWANLGMSAGSQYTISWLQWVDKLNKYANAAFYSRNTSNSWGFHDGMTNGRATALNTKVRKWQRVYSTFTVSSNRNLSDSNGNVYMYGHYATRGTVKIADVQLELNNHPTAYQEFDGSDTYKQSRSSTEGILDLTKNVNIDTSNISFDTNGFLTFDGTDDYMRMSSIPNRPTTQITCEAVINPSRTPSTGTIRGTVIGDQSTLYLGIINSIDGGTGHALHWALPLSNGTRPSSWHGSIPKNKFTHIVGTYDGSTSRAYINGVQVWSTSASGNVGGTTYNIGIYNNRTNDGTHNFEGYIPVAKIYNRAITPQEIKQNFRAYKNRFNI